MKELLFRPVSDESGAFLPWLNALRNCSGAYVIRSWFLERILYVGESHSGNLAKTIKRHFYPWRDDPERRHSVYDRKKVEVAVRLTPPNSATGAQNNLIRELEPRDNSYIPAENPF